AHYAFAHVRLWSVRDPRWGASFRECFAPHLGYYRSLLRASSAYWRTLAKRIRGGDLCHPSVAGGVGRLDCRTQRRFEWILLYAHARRVSALHAQTIDRPLPDDVDLVCLRVDVETDVGFSANCSFAPGLLASQTPGRSAHFEKLGRGKVSAISVEHRVRRGNADRTDASDWFFCTASAFFA